MLLGISILMAIIHSLLKPLGEGLSNTSMWVTKILAPIDSEDNEVTKQFMRIGQAALMDGWLSNIPFISTILFFLSIATAFFFSWWAAIAVFLLCIVLDSITNLLMIRSVTYYLIFIHHKMINRVADYKAKSDIERYDAAESFSKDLEKIISIYQNSTLKPPTPEQLKEIPFGDVCYWIDSGRA